MNIKCACGFEVTDDDSINAVNALEEHDCPNVVSESRWHDSVFSFWGAMILFIVAAAAMKILTGLDW